MVTVSKLILGDMAATSNFHHNKRLLRIQYKKHAVLTPNLHAKLCGDVTFEPHNHMQKLYC